MARDDARSLGLGAEQLAVDYLVRRGVQVIHRNFRCRLGEIDLIVQDDRCLVFVEVRYRGCGSFSRAGQTVDRHKQRKLIRTAALYVAKRPQYSHSVMRFDVIAIDAGQDGATTTSWIRDAFRPTDSQL